jgi:hypothetical protein
MTNVLLVLPCGTVMDAGAVATLVLLLTNVILTPLGPAALFNVTVPTD